MVYFQARYDGKPVFFSARSADLYDPDKVVDITVDQDSDRQQDEIGVQILSVPIGHLTEIGRETLEEWGATE